MRKDLYHQIYADVCLKYSKTLNSGYQHTIAKKIIRGMNRETTPDDIPMTKVWVKMKKKYKVIQIADYRKIRISKGKNKYRTIYIPDDYKTQQLKECLFEIRKSYKNHVVYEVDHAFVGGKNCVTNAMQHLKHRYVLSLDIANFFDSIQSHHVKDILSETMIHKTFVNNALPQGFLTSPMIANIAMIPIDKMIVEHIIMSRLKDSSVIYTRYADDLTFSFDQLVEKDVIIAEVIKILRLFNLKINKKKIQLYDKQHGRAIVTGVAIDYVNVYPTRKTIKKIRAARHQHNSSSLHGLLEWSLCKVPKKAQA